jgi:Flp pilus assembly protein TadB
MGAITSTGGFLDSNLVFLLVFGLASLVIALIYFRNSRKRGRLSSYLISSENLGEIKIQGKKENRTTFSSEDLRSEKSHPSFRTAYGRKALIGVIAGLSIIVGDILFYSIVIPATTISEEFTTVAILVIGVAVAACSNLSGLIRLANAKKSENRSDT